MRGVLETWRNGLLDLTGANPLMDVDPEGPGVVAVMSPSPRSVVEALQQGRECGFLGIEEQAEGPRPRAAHVFQTRMADADMDTTLHALRRTDRRDQLEHGSAGLYLAIGTLHWRDGEHEYASPILLLPVELVHTDPLDYPRLRARADDPIVNPALTVRLRLYGVELPTVDGLAGLDVTVFWARLDAAIGEHQEWRTDEAILLSRFAVDREIMYGDLVDNERQILAHPVIRALATDPKSQIEAFRFEPIPPRRIDELAPPDDVPLVLDADAAQRACVSAALAGRSFVMRGAPGTGKTQTVANMIACLLHAGKRVLMVSEKAAALDTVRERMARTGLEDYLLELHSGRTGRVQVASTLAAALDYIPLPPPSLSTDEREELREHRRRLNAYAEAMNEVREPLGHRLHDVLGMCAQMIDVPAAPVPPTLPVPLTTQSLQKVRDAAERLGKAWRPALQGDDFLWRDVIDRNRLDARLHQAQTALEHLTEAAAGDPLAEAFDAHALTDAITLTTLVGHAARRPPEAADEWLTLPSLESVARSAEGLLRHLKALHQAEDAVRSRAGVTWSALPTPSKLPIVPSLAQLDPPAVELLPITAAQARGLARRFADEADRLEQHQHSLDRVTARLGLPNVVAFTDIGRVAAIVDLLSRPHKPEAGWFDTTGMAAAQTASRILKRAVEAAQAAESRAREYFNEAALNEPVDELAERFAAQHKGMRKLRAPYRRDKKAAADIARPDVKRSQAVANLSAAAAWKRSIQELEEAEAEHAKILGRHWRRLETDFDAIQEALRTAEEVLQVTPPEALPAVIERVSAPTPNSAIIRIVTEARKEFDRWTAALRPPPEPAPRPQLAAGPIHDAVTWLRAHVEPFTAVAELVQAYSAAAGRDFTLAESAAIGMLREAASDAAAALSANASEYAKVLGGVYRGTQTDVEALATAMAWTSEARRVRTGGDIAFTAEQAEVLSRARPTDTLPSRVAEWQAARDWILRAFAPRRHPSLTAALDDYEHARELLKALLEDSRGQQEWFEYQAARSVLSEHGLDTVVDFCARADLPIEQILPVLGRALFQSWADTVIREDDRLPPLDASGHDRLVQEFQLWDTRLQRAAAADVMNAVDARQPSDTATSEAALLRSTAAQQGRRLAVRDLIAQTRHATTAVKPCFLTVPAGVSRLLPPDLQFDVVIVDEAARMPIPDAITCAYRGAALIVVGDDRQVTSATLPSGEAQSILDLAIGCGAFRVIDLPIHYRSRHESLITFANHSFYAGGLSTFPAAGAPGPDAGVQLFPAGEGTLSQLVASRVAHHLVTRPDLTLGVVACSPEQAHEIEAAVADMVATQDGDRLRGFFVKDLDTVQGDERDVIIMAIGEDLGGLQGPLGWRRLNTATTRASRRLEVVSEVRGRDLPENEEFRHLAAYLDYAVRGEAALGIEDVRPDQQVPFEDSVRDVLRAWGYRVQTRVGAGSFRIDLAIRRNARRNAPFALGIECDGTTYDSAPAARDRDRLREQELQGLGWRLHRVWGTAWYLDRQHEEDRLRAALDAAFAEFPAEQAPELTVTVTETPAAEPEPIIAETTAPATEAEMEMEAEAELEPEPEPEPAEVLTLAEEPVLDEEPVQEEEAVPEPEQSWDAVEEPQYTDDDLIDEDFEIGAEQAGAYLAGVEDVNRETVEETPAASTWPAATGMEFDDDLEPPMATAEEQAAEEQAAEEQAVEEQAAEEQQVAPVLFERLSRAEVAADLHPHQHAEERPFVAPAVEPIPPAEPLEPISATGMEWTTAPRRRPSRRPRAEPVTADVPEAVDRSSEWAFPYEKVVLNPISPGAGLTEPGMRTRIAEAVAELARVEGPVHIDLVLQRMREQWALTRITKQARTVVEGLLESGETGMTWDGAFVSDPERTVPAIRLRAEGVSRKPDQIADSELRLAMEHLVHDGGVLTTEDLLAATGRLYGWASRRSAELDARLTGLIAELVAEEHLSRVGDGLTYRHGLPDVASLPRHEAAPKRRRKSTAGRK
ncbi:DUF3320 domain-containing protein [Actinoplanes sp. NPDC051861]|uniref:DUF3320 domain-containing protein n=1 Tax=Actinoplanes sp. NPDC051861 TaxID=3155170 RepID=UPI0034355C61